MKVPRVLPVLTLLAFSAGGVRGATPETPTPAAPVTIAATVDLLVTNVEKRVTDAAEAMPESKFDFSPESLNVSGADYKGVRSFALQVRHIAASNYAIWSPVTGEKIPDDWKGGNGPENLKTKAEILKFLKDSFALGHRAAASLTEKNLLDDVSKGRTRLYMTTFAATHAYDHYGQIVEYLRMNGIVPPASRGN